MAIQFNRREEILNRLEKEGKILHIDSEEALRIQKEIDDFLSEIRREYLEKERLSIISASETILTC